MYSNSQFFINGTWQNALNGATLPVINPATEEEIGTLPKAGIDDLNLAIESADIGFQIWKKTSAYDRSRIMRKAAQLLRDRADQIAPIMTMEQGKPVGEARMEALSCADVIDWFAEESRRTYGRIIPGRADRVRQLVIREPVGIVAAFSPWNFPINQSVRKISAALAAGCSIIVKGPEETPRSCAMLVACFADAGVPAGVVNLVFGIPAQISEYLIAHPKIAKISFTGSTVVGKQLAALAGLHMKRATMELGGHAPVIICDDADIPRAAQIMAASKFRNAGQVCVSPTRFLVQDKVFSQFRDLFVQHGQAIKVGNGLEEGVTMGPLAHARRMDAMNDLVADARQSGANVALGGNRKGNKGYFFEPTVLTNVPKTARIMNEEPFGPIALMNPFSHIEEAITEANRLPYGLAAYAFTSSEKTVTTLADNVESGMLTINHLGLALPEVPFGGIKDSGYGTEGGADALEPYLISKYVTHMSI